MIQCIIWLVFKYNKIYSVKLRIHNNTYDLQRIYASANSKIISSLPILSKGSWKWQISILTHINICPNFHRNANINNMTLFGMLKQTIVIWTANDVFCVKKMSKMTSGGNEIYSEMLMHFLSLVIKRKWKYFLKI